MVDSSSLQEGTNVLVTVIMALIGIVIVYIIVGFIVKITWNVSMPALFSGLGEIDLKQAIALVILTHLLFSGDLYGASYIKTLYDTVMGVQVTVSNQQAMASSMPAVAQK